jgi:hypothetical protein
LTPLPRSPNAFSYIHPYLPTQPLKSSSSLGLKPINTPDYSYPPSWQPFFFHPQHSIMHTTPSGLKKSSYYYPRSNLFPTKHQL